jgi:hypothetical protein
MPKKDYNRYSILRSNEESMPYVDIPVNPSDKFEYWNTEFSRMDKVSDKYYGNPFYDFLIIYANGMYVSEFDIPDGALIRIPFPLAKAKSDYEAKLKYIITQ